MVIILVFCVFTTRATRWQHQFVSIRFNCDFILDRSYLWGLNHENKLKTACKKKYKLRFIFFYMILLKTSSSKTAISMILEKLENVIILYVSIGKAKNVIILYVSIRKAKKCYYFICEC